MAEEKPTTVAQLSAWDAVSLIVGIVVGVSIFSVSDVVCSNVSGPWTTLGVWLLGGMLSFIGALCYAELATAFPKTGGDYVYLTRAYGRPVGFLFGWSHLAGILTGSIGAIAFVFADYSTKFFGSSPDVHLWCALGSVMGLTLVNLCGVVFSKTAQNLLTVAKVLGLVSVAVVGMVWGEAGFGQFADDLHSFQWPELSSVGFAMIMVLYAYGGWNDAAFIAAEVRNPQRNVSRALLWGVSLITLIYLLVNLGYLTGLGFAAVRESQVPAADVLSPVFGNTGSQVMAALVMVSALGALNGLILTGSRVHAGLGGDHRLFSWLGYWHPRTGAPIFSLAAQAFVAVALMFSVGTESGREALDGLLTSAGGEAVEWQRFGSGFDALVSATAPVFWSFFLLTGLSLFVLRIREPLTERPFRVPLFPVTPLAFCGMCGYMLYSSITWAGWLAAVVLVPFALGVPLYLISQQVSKAK